MALNQTVNDVAALYVTVRAELVRPNVCHVTTCCIVNSLIASSSNVTEIVYIA